MTFTVVLTVLGSVGGLAVLLLMAVTPILKALPLPRRPRGTEVSIPAQRTGSAPTPVRRSLHAA